MSSVYFLISQWRLVDGKTNEGKEKKLNTLLFNWWFASVATSVVTDKYQSNVCVCVWCDTRQRKIRINYNIIVDRVNSGVSEWSNKKIWLQIHGHHSIGFGQLNHRFSMLCSTRTHRPSKLNRSSSNHRITKFLLWSSVWRRDYGIIEWSIVDLSEIRISCRSHIQSDQMVHLVFWAVQIGVGLISVAQHHNSPTIAT